MRSPCLSASFVPATAPSQLPVTKKTMPIRIESTLSSTTERKTPLAMLTWRTPTLTMSVSSHMSSSERICGSKGRPRRKLKPLCSASTAPSTYSDVAHDAPR